MARATFAPTAQADLIAIYDFVAVDNRTAAGRLIDRFEHQAEKLAEHPGIGRTRPELRADLRSFAIGKYVLLYRAVAGGIEVVRVLHGMRDIDRIFEAEE
jgi:toxin ParE1/3/4